VKNVLVSVHGNENEEFFCQSERGVSLSGEGESFMIGNFRLLSLRFKYIKKLRVAPLINFLKVCFFVARHKHDH
jgi:hypothetical protein